MRPSRQSPQHERKRSIQLLDLKVGAHSLAVRRVRNDAAVLGLRSQFAEGPLLPVDVVDDARLFGVIAGEAQELPD